MPPSEATLLKQAQAAAWALNQIGRQDYYNLCQRFIENAYGTQSQFGSAAAAGNALNLKTDPYEADVGDLVFFRPDPSNGNAGHVGINIGGGQMVSSTNKGVTVDNFLTNPYWKNLLVGLGDPPEQWQGRPDAKDLVSGATTLVAQGKATAGNAVAGAWGAAAPYAQQLLTASSKHGVPVNVLAGLLIQESGGDPRAVSRAGAQGLMQFMPGTARGMGIDPFNPAQAIDGGARYLKQLADQSGGDWQQAVGKYNAGPAGNLNNAETRNHIVKVMQFADTIGASMGGGAGVPGLPPPGGGGGRRPEDDVAERTPQANPYRGTDRGGNTAELQRLLDQIGQWGGDRLGGLNIQSGQRQPGRGVEPIAPGVPGLEGVTRPTPIPNAPNQTVQIDLELLKSALAGGGSGLNDFLRGLVEGGVGQLPGGRFVAPSVAGAAGNALARGGAITGPGGSIAGPPGAPPTAGPGGPPPPGGGDLIDPSTGSPVSRTPGTGVPATATTATGSRRPAGWLDPSKYPGAYGAIIEQANAYMLQIEDAQAAMKGKAPDSLEYNQAVRQLQAAQAALVQMGPNLANIQKEVGGQEEGTILPGTTPSSNYISIIRKKADGSGYELVQVPNPNPEASTAEVGAKAQTDAARISAEASRANAEAAAAASRYGSDQSLAGTRLTSEASRYGSDQSLRGTQYAADAGERNARLNALTQLGTTEMTTTTQRVTAALSAAVEQQRTKIDAAIRAGDLTLRDGTERFNQWYKQNVEAPLAILQQQRETERYKVEQQEAATRRATGQSEHERGVAQIGQQMWTGAANAYSEMIPRTVGAGWGEGFQRNLSQPGPYQANTGATYNVSESMDEFATRKVAEMLKGVSPYAANIANAQGQLGANAAPMGGQQMTALQNQATGVASNALANPFTMAPMNPLQMPGDIDIGAMAGIGANNGGLITGAVNAANQPRPNVPALPAPPDFSYTAGTGPGRG